MTVYKQRPQADARAAARAREKLAETYRQQGMVADALRELELSANELQQAGKIEETLPALRRSSGLHPG